MKHLNIPVLISLFGLIIGIVLADYIEDSLHYIFGSLAMLVLVLFSIHLLANKRRFFTGVFAILTLSFFIALGLLLHKKALPEYIASHYFHQDNTKVASILIEIKERLKPSPYQDKYIAKVLQWGDHPLTGHLLLNIDKDSLTTSLLPVGTRLHVRGSITQVSAPKNPYQFDYGHYLKRKRIYGQLSISQDKALLSKTHGNGVRVWVARFRESVQEKLESHSFTATQLAIINALILGQRQGIDREMSQQYAAAGMMHILAVSGLHVGIILLLLRIVTRPINRFKWRFLRSGIIILCIWGFAILTGLSPSVLRAATMFSFLEASTLLGSKKESSNALIVSALVLLLIDPLLIYQVGFQLSYLAVFSILWIQPWLSGLLKINNWILKKLWDTATLTTAAQLGVMPLSLFYFHQFPGLFLVSNIFIIPLLGLILGAGITVVILVGLEKLPPFFATSFGKVIDLLNGFIAWIASKEEFVFQHISISATVMIALYILIFAIISFLKNRTYLRLIWGLIGVLIFCTVLGWEKSKPIQQQLIIFHKTRQTLLGIANHNKLHLKTNDTLWEYAQDSRIKLLRDHRAFSSIEVSKLANIISFKDNRILVIDSLGVYGLQDFEPAYILLTQSPNINLDRLLMSFPNATIIADGNNYKSDIDRWKATCRKQKIPFHSTYEKGAFTIE